MTAALDIHDDPFTGVMGPRRGTGRSANVLTATIDSDDTFREVLLEVRAAANGAHPDALDRLATYAFERYLGSSRYQCAAALGLADINARDQEFNDRLLKAADVRLGLLTNSDVGPPLGELLQADIEGSIDIAAVAAYCDLLTTAGPQQAPYMQLLLNAVREPLIVRGIAPCELLDRTEWRNLLNSTLNMFADNAQLTINTRLREEAGLPVPGAPR